MGYEPVALPTGKMYGPVFFSCTRCGAVVWLDAGKARHDQWHRDLGLRLPR
jgi:hypothetical protein